jgi:hypothetical protein
MDAPNLSLLGTRLGSRVLGYRLAINGLYHMGQQER